MAPAPEKTDPPEIQTVALKVSIHCEGCKKKVKKVLQRVEGVGNIDIDSKQNKVTVTGSATADSLIQKLGKYGKQAEIWPETKVSAAGKVSGEPKEEGKEKDASVSTVIATPPETDQQQPVTEKKQQAEEAKQVPPPPPAETTKTASSGEVTGSPDNIEPAKSEKPASADEPENSKRKGKKGEIGAGDETAVPDTNESAARTSAAAAVNPAIPHPFPAYPPSSYTVSYNTVRPSISYSHYAPSPTIPSSYTTYSGIPPPAGLPSSYATYSNYTPTMPSSYTTYSSYESVPTYPPENYSTDSYYGSMEAPGAAAEGSYDMFNDENPNACNLM